MQPDFRSSHYTYTSVPRLQGCRKQHMAIGMIRRVAMQREGGLALPRRHVNNALEDTHNESPTTHWRCITRQSHVRRW
jgi:hypothetical protein